MRKTLNLILFCAASLLLLEGCSTKKNTLTRRMFHNLTSHYNIYWNGEQSLKEGDKQLKAQVKDDYTNVLRVYNYGTQQDGMGMNAKMDRALEKTSICVQKHSMKFNSRERVRWIDDAYLVMGKAHFYKHDYIPARRTFDFVATEYSYNDIALVANLWLIKTYIQTEQYPRAIASIEQLQAKTAGIAKLPKELMQNMDFTIADYYIAVKDYNNAMKYLQNGLLYNKDRDTQTRAMFIMGQIYMQQNDAERAIATFKKVVKRNPIYEMSFEARMNMAKMGSTENAAQMYKMLNKMLRDPNNDDYRDRIYYAMAELALREGDESKALNYLRKSVAAFKDNRIQRAMSSLKAASMYFEKSNYELSQAYYDTAVNSMERQYPGYDSILNISQTLNELVMYANVVREQDSLLRVAAMDSVQRNILIDRIIAQVIEQEEREKEQREYEEQLALMGAATGDAPKTSEPTLSTGSSWYFYNQTALTKGYTEFTRKWGMRRNEDNWRISDKQSMSAFLNGEDDNEEMTENKNAKAKQDSLNASYTNHDRGYYLRDLPFEPEQKEVCDSLIADGLYNLGFLYLDRLNDLPRSIESYTSLDTRYPNNKKELPCWYALYKMYKDLSDEDNSLIYKNKILDKYPTSSYAQFINDPDYFKKLQEQEKESSEFYAKTYEAFEQGQYYRVKMNTERAMELYEADTAMMPRFAFLHAVASGRLVAVDTMAFELYRLVHKYPGHSITPYAQQVLQHINDEYQLGLVLNNGKSGDEEPEVKKASPYTYKPDSEHFVMIVCNSRLVRIDPLKVRISDFNKREYSIRSFNVRSVMLDDDNTVITIGNFEDQSQADNYITSMFLTDYVFGGIDSNYYTVKPISGTNYPIFYQSKNLEEYIQFLESNNK